METELKLWSQIRYRKVPGARYNHWVLLVPCWLGGVDTATSSQGQNAQTPASYQQPREPDLRKALLNTCPHAPLIILVLLTMVPSPTPVRGIAILRPMELAKVTPAKMSLLPDLPLGPDCLLLDSTVGPVGNNPGLHF